MRVLVQSDLSGYTGYGTVATIGSVTASTSGPNAGMSYLPMRVKPQGAWPRSLEGQDVELTVVAATTGKPVLAVPEAAISTNAGGQTTVSVLTRGGGLEEVVVTTGAAGNGYVAVTPARPSSLKAGMRVVVGLGSAGRP